MMPTLRQLSIARLSRLYPLMSGCASFANSALLRKLTGDSPEVAWTRVPGGEVLAPLDDYIGRAAFYVGDLDRKITSICRRVLRPGDTVLDVGANIGIMMVLFSSIVGVSGNVHAFEPNPALVAFLSRVRERGRLSNVTLHAIALGDDEARLDLRVPRGNTGAASLIRAPGEVGTSITVPVRRLSAVIAESGIGPIRLVKIDVEGFEPQVLAGARDAFAARPPDMVVFELNGAEGPIAEHPTIRILRDLGYALFSIPKSLFRLEVRAFDPEVSPRPESNDFLAVQRGNAHRDILDSLA